jgi:hypothetical protein
MATQVGLAQTESPRDTSEAASLVPRLELASMASTPTAEGGLTSPAAATELPGDSAWDELAAALSELDAALVGIEAWDVVTP